MHRGDAVASAMTFVLVHGGGFTGACWERMLPFLDGEVIAVDLPGRGRRPADLTKLTLDDFAEAVVDDIVSGDHDEVVLVGHSLAGVTLPRVAGRIADRLRRMVYVSCSAPPNGVSVAEVLSTLSPVVAEVAAQLGDGIVSAEGALDPDLATAMFCNDMDDEQREHTLSLMVPEAIGVISEPSDLSGLAVGVPATYVRLLRDQSLTLETQDRMLANLGISDAIDLDAGHMAMISQPEALAQILNQL